MILIGQYDSPFVRRVGVALTLYGLGFGHRPWSTFADAEKLAALNPMLRVPTLILDDGETLLDSAAILDHLDSLVPPGRAMLAASGPQRRAALRVTAIACGLGDQAVSLFYERVLHREPSATFMARRSGQIAGGFAWLEREAAARSGPFWFGADISHADVAIACVWRFVAEAHPGLVAAPAHSALAALAARCEALPAFAACAQPFVPPA